MRFIGKRIALLALITVAILGPTCAKAAERDVLDHFWEKSEVITESPGMLFRIDFDITGDGVAELFLAHSQLTGTSGVQEWFVYSRTATDSRFRFRGTVEFSYLLFRLSSDGLKLLAYQQDAGPMGNVVTYGLAESGFAAESSETNVAAAARAEEFASWRKQVGLRVLTTGLSELNGARLPNWIDLLTKKSVSGVTSLEGLIVVD